MVQPIEYRGHLIYISEKIEQCPDRKFFYAFAHTPTGSRLGETPYFKTALSALEFMQQRIDKRLVINEGQEQLAL